jgi:hypothetical protein
MERKIHQAIVKCARNLQPYNIDSLQKVCRWTKRDKTAEGNQGQVYQACCDEDCKFIVKAIDHKGRWTFDDIQAEISMQQNFAKNGLTPPVREAFMCDNWSYIISDAKVQTLLNILEELADVPKAGKWDFENSSFIKSAMTKLLQRAVEVIEEANSHGLMHDDAHMSNFMVDVAVVDDEESLQKALKSLQLIDFGYSKVLSDDPEERAQQENDDMDRLFTSVSEQPWGAKFLPTLHFRKYIPPY